MEEQKIRKLEAADYAAVYQISCEVHALHVAARPDIYHLACPMNEAYYRELLQNPHSFLYAVERQGTLCGFCLAYLKEITAHPALRPRRVLYIDTMAVTAAQRGQGLGRSLFCFLREQALAQGMDAVELNVLAFNEGAQAFYRSMGMETKNMTMELRL